MSKYLKRVLTVTMLVAILAGSANVASEVQIIPEALAASKASVPTSTEAPVEGVSEEAEFKNDFFILDKEMLEIIVQLSQLSNKDHSNDWGFEFISAEPEKIVWKVNDSLTLKIRPTFTGKGKKTKYTGVDFVDIITQDPETGLTKGFRRKYDKNGEVMSNTMYTVKDDNWEESEYVILTPGIDSDAMITTFTQDPTTFDEMFSLDKKDMPKSPN